MVPVIRGTVTEAGRLELSSAARALLGLHLTRLRGQAVDVVVRRHVAHRSTRANAYYFGVVLPVLAAHCGYDDKTELHEALAFKFLRLEDDPLTGSPRRQKTSALDARAFADYVDACVRLAAELGVVIPAPGLVEAA